MHHLQLRQRWALLAMVAALAGVTATSVALAIAELIDNTLLAVLFASAAVVLDLFKYIAWPLALGLLAIRRTMSALLMMACALALGGVSGWASYDRLMSSIITAAHTRAGTRPGSSNSETGTPTGTGRNQAGNSSRRHTGRADAAHSQYGKRNQGGSASGRQGAADR